MTELVSDLSVEQIAQKLVQDGLLLSTPPYNFRLHTRYPQVARALSIVYSDYSIGKTDCLIDFSLDLRPVAGVRRFFSPLMNLEVDGYRPFDALPANQVFPLLEWGMNWCVTSTAHHWVVCHSAVLARDDFSVILPAPPGSGKSTLCAALMLSGWRLLSDEMALIETETGEIWPFVRPVSLKNASIDIIRSRYDHALMSQKVHDTVKGTVAHLKPTKCSVDASQRKALPRWLVFPKYQSHVDLELRSISKAEAMVDLAANTFNLAALGPKAFDVLTNLVEQCDCFRLDYSDLDQAVACFDQLSGATASSDASDCL